MDDPGGFCLLHPTGVTKEAVLQEEENEGSVEDEEGVLRIGVDGVVMLLFDVLYQDGTFSFSMLACILF